MLLGTLGKLYEVLRMDGGLQAVVRWRPRSLTNFRIISDLRRDGVAFRTIIDGGANVGQFSRAASWAFPEAKIIAFEPLPDVAEQLRQNLSDGPRVSVVCAALGDRDGSVTFRRHAYSQASSILSQSSQSRKLDVGYDKAGEIDTLTVPMVRLDTALREHRLEEPILLKLDLQGFELPALHGAPQLLQRASRVLSELVFAEAYEGEATFDEVRQFLQDAGFGFDRPLSFERARNGSIVQIDALFSRRRHCVHGAAVPSSEPVPTASA